MVRNFKGVVKVSEVQEEFDNLLNTINAKIDTYNSSLDIEDVDYNNGGADLAPYGYTLSVGGLKKVLDAYDGAILGANVLRISNNQYIVSEGLYIKDRIVTKLPSKVLSGTGDTVYFDDVNSNYTFVKGGGTVVIPWASARISGTDTTPLGEVSVESIYPESCDFGVTDASGFFADNQFAAYLGDKVAGGTHWDAGFKVTWILPEVVNITQIDYSGFCNVGSGGGNAQSNVYFYDENGTELDWRIPINDWSATGEKSYNVSKAYSVSSVKKIEITMTASPNSDDNYESYTVGLGNIRASGNITSGTPGGTILISPINKNRISRLCNRPNATNEEIPDYKVTIESKNSGYVINGNQYLSNSDKGQFYSGSAGRNCRINLFDTQVAYHQWHGDRTDSYHEPFNFMFIPKGIPNPYNGLAGEIRFAMQKVWNYILHRPSR